MLTRKKAHSALVEVGVLQLAIAAAGGAGMFFSALDPTIGIVLVMYGMLGINTLRGAKDFAPAKPSVQR